MSVDSFVKNLLPYAKSVSTVTGIRPESILAQAGLETGWNENPPGNNYFGIKKGTNWKGNTVLIRTKEVLSKSDVAFPKIYSVTKRSDGKYLYDVLDSFRAYPSPADSFADWSALIKTRYPTAYAARNDKAAFSRALQAGGYASDPKYASKLVAVLNSVEWRLGLPLTKAVAVGGSVAVLAVVGAVAYASTRS